MRRVDLPTPGSPPTSTTLPGTTPPPRTRLSSPQARAVRGASSAGMSVTATGRGRSWGRAAAAFSDLDWALIVNSWSVFQALQWGHWPAQRMLSPPHWEHTKVVRLGVERGIPRSLAALGGIYKRGINRARLKGAFALGCGPAPPREGCVRPRMKPFGRVGPLDKVEGLDVRLAPPLSSTSAALTTPGAAHFLDPLPDRKGIRNPRARPAPPG